MADLNYMSPSGMQPKVGWSPEGFLGGVKWQEQEKDYRDSLDLQKAMSMFGIKKQQNELSDYELNSPVRAATRQADITKANTTVETSLADALAGIDQKKGSAAHSNAQARQLDAETLNLPALRKAQITEYEDKHRANQHAQLTNIIGSIAAIKGKGGTLSLPDSLVLNNHFKELGIDPRSPEAAHIFNDAENIMKRISALDPAQIGKMAQIAETGKYQVAAAGARTPAERTDITMLNAIEEGLKQDPRTKGMTPEQIKSLAVRQLLQFKANINGYRTPETAEEKARGEIKGTLGAVNDLINNGQTRPNPQGGGAPVPPANNAPAMPPLPPGFQINR